MYKINEVKIDVGMSLDDNSLISLLSNKLKINEDEIMSIKLDRLSLDARQKSNIHYKGNIIFEVKKKLDLSKYKNITQYTPTEKIKTKWRGGDEKIIVVGSGPSGLFAGLKLCNSGKTVTVLERGYDMDKRINAVANMMDNGVLDEKSNIQFGEGGAGTFSDGKLNTGINSILCDEVLHSFCQFGASSEILYSNKAHIGTDVLSKVIVNIRNYMIDKGCEFLFEHTLKSIDSKNKIISVDTSTGLIEMEYDELILALGHSSRDTIRELYKNGLELKRKPFSLGFRIEHLQSDINYSQYGEMSFRNVLPPADYHLSTHLPNGRCVYTFCMCPGGVVVPATSESGHVVTNGMSYSSRGGVNANSAVLISVTPDDFPEGDELSGLAWQEEIESLAYSKTNSFYATVQKVGDFLNGRVSESLGKVIPTYKPGYVLGSVEDILPPHLTHSLKVGIIELDKKLHGFADNDAILTAVETRSSAPYQVVRNEKMETNFSNVYMIGEGAGMAGGIVSSAVEGLKVAQILIDKYNN